MTITPGTLYLVGTPIGNLGDLSPRALETLSKVDFIAAEDTRVTGSLLAHHGIKKPLVSYYEHNLRQRGEQILARLKAGESCALCTDAGMPAISDPGCDIVRCRDLRPSPRRWPSRGWTPDGLSSTGFCPPAARAALNTWPP